MSGRSLSTLSHLKFRHLLLVEYLLEEGTIHKAARKLSMSQPAATAMLNDLESLIGLPLFVRSRQGVLPTEQAQVIASRMRTILSEFDELTTLIARVADGRGSRLRVGVLPQAFISYLPQAVRFFREAGGGALHTQEGNARQLLALLTEGELDCVVGRLPHDGSELVSAEGPLDFINLYDDEICIVAGPGNPAATVPGLTLADLAKCEWVMPRADSNVRQALAESFLREGIQPPEPIVETSTYIQDLTLVANSGFFTAAPKRAARMQQALGLIKIVDVPLSVIPAQVRFIARKSSARNASLVKFRDALVASVAQDTAIAGLLPDGHPGAGAQPALVGVAVGVAPGATTANRR